MKQLIIKICRQCNLGEPVSDPFPLTGGLMHKMYGIYTNKGKYAVKLLNPFVMKRETAKENFKAAEQLEGILEEKGIPILPARTFNSCKMQETDGQYFYIFDWYDGKPVYKDEVKQKHCAEIGKTLAQIHRIDQRASGGERDMLHIDWNLYCRAVKAEDKEIYELLGEYIPLLNKIQQRGNDASSRIPPLTAICHNDMDSKNVLWKGWEYRIIDLECLSYSNPLAELLETALYWSGFEEHNLDLERFRSFKAAYIEGGGNLPEDWEALYDSNNGRLLWLEYNLKRALGIDCSPSEKGLGREETIKTLGHIGYYDKMREQFLTLACKT